MIVAKILRKRTKRAEPIPSMSLGRAAAQAIADITSDLTMDWTAREIAAEAERRGMVPTKVYAEARENAVYNWISEAGRNAKRRIGSRNLSRCPRRFGSYLVKEQNKEGRDVTVYCWREWESMKLNHMISAQQELFKQAKAAKRAAIATHKFCNKLLIDRGENPIELEQVIHPD
jgi:hypothetical protein